VLLDRATHPIPLLRCPYLRKWPVGSYIRTHRYWRKHELRRVGRPVLAVGAASLELCHRAGRQKLSGQLVSKMICGGDSGTGQRHKDSENRFFDMRFSIRYYVKRTWQQFTVVISAKVNYYILETINKHMCADDWTGWPSLVLSLIDIRFPNHSWVN
jgi:hypothetical protein